MNCPNCGAPVSEGASFCGNCGASFSAPQPQPVAPQPVQQSSYNTYPQTPSYPVSGSVPPENKPLSPWAYFGYTLLFSLPVIGFICLIIFSVDNGNINRRNFARSYWIWFVLAIVIGTVVGILFAIFGTSIANEVSNFRYY
ncbi:MAG: zinc-ribbon domain-containing protein [Ruminococcaceae bacterium]|nr:zinc-ribbon domain-containing protein [Oscillospiraceae bacterium]